MHVLTAWCMQLLLLTTVPLDGACVGSARACMCCCQAYNAEKAGAKAIIVADYKDERLLTMAVPEDRPEIAKLKNDITIPTALVTLEVRVTDIPCVCSPSIWLAG
jgi:hypothetical protein